MPLRPEEDIQPFRQKFSFYPEFKKVQFQIVSVFASYSSELKSFLFGLSKLYKVTLADTLQVLRICSDR